MDSLNNNIQSSNFNFINRHHQNLREQGVSLDTAHLNTEVYNLKLVYAWEITEIRNSNTSVEPDELEATLNRVDTDVRIGVANGICAVTESKGEAIDILFGKIDGELKNIANETWIGIRER